MTFWEMFNNHPIVGFFLASTAIIVAGLTAENALNAVVIVLRAKITGAACDCVECDREHLCGIAAGIHPEDERCQFPEDHEGPCSHGVPRDA